MILLAGCLLADEEFHPVSPTGQGAVWKQLDAAHNQLTNFIAEVAQTKTMQILQRPIVSKAKLWFEKPNLFRWEVVEPVQSLIVSDGKSLWMHYPEFQQAERYPLGDPRLTNGPAKTMGVMLGASPAALTNTCDISMFASPHCYRLEVVPRDPNEKQLLSRLVLDFDRENFAIRRTVIESANGDRTENRFTITEVNADMSESLFRFTPPPDTKIARPFAK